MPFRSSTKITTTKKLKSHNHQLILQLDFLTVYFVHTVRDFVHIFPKLMDRKRRAESSGPISSDLTPLDFFLFGLCEDKMYRQRVNMLEELKPRITRPAACVTKDILQVLQMVGYM
jgi:hypothetical protein